MTNRPTKSTAMGGSGRDFPATTIGLIEHLGMEGRSGVQELARRFWKPVYWFIRRAWSKSNEDAKDFTQDFFAWLSESDVLSRYRRERGSLRAFVKTLLRRFLSHRDVAARRLKRGGGVRIVPLPEGAPDEPDAPAGAEADEVFDAAWIGEILRAAVQRVRERLEGAGRGVQFRVFEAVDLAPDSEPPTYGEVGRRMGLKETAVRDHLAAVRRELREEIRRDLALLTCSERELIEEWNAFFRTR